MEVACAVCNTNSRTESNFAVQDDIFVIVWEWNVLIKIFPC